MTTIDGASHRPPPTVTVFGGGGYIGRAICRRFKAAGWRVIAIARSDGSAAAAEQAGAHAVRGTLEEPETWASPVAGSDAVIQVAASFGPEMAEAETRWTAAFIDQCRARSRPVRLIYTGGCWLFPDRCDPPVGDDTPFAPLDAFSFLVRNRAALIAAGVDIVTVHPGMVWDRQGGFLAPFLAALARGGIVEIPRSADVRWPTVQVDDLAALYLAATLRGTAGDDFLGASQAGIPLWRIAGIAGRLSGVQPRLGIVSTAKLAARHGPWAVGYGRSQTIVSDKAERLLGWKPRHFLGMPRFADG